MKKEKKETLRFYTIDDNYVDYLLQVESKVMFNKSTRPYAGIVYVTSNYKYFIPMTSLLNKKNAGKHIPEDSLYFRRIKNGEHGGMSIRNMIPVPDACLHYLDFAEIHDENYRKGMYAQYRAAKTIWPDVLKAAEKVYHICMKTGKQLSKDERKIKKDCCNFKLLEQKCKEYEENMKCCDDAFE